MSKKRRSKGHWQGLPQYGRSPSKSNGKNKYDEGYFINPYNFVPFDVGNPPPKKARPSHEKFAGLSGRITCEIETLTPLVIPDGEKIHGHPDCTDHKVKPLLLVDGKPYIPGASIKGAIRSVMEAVTNSCMSVLTQGYAIFRDNRDFAVYNRRLGRLEKTSDGKWIVRDINPDSGDSISIIEHKPQGDRVAIWKARLHLLRDERRNLFPDSQTIEPKPTNTSRTFQGRFKWYDLLRGLFGDSERRDFDEKGDQIPFDKKKALEKRRIGKPVFIRWPVADPDGRPKFPLDGNLLKQYAEMVESEEFKKFDDKKIDLENWQQKYLKPGDNRIFWYRVPKKIDQVIQFGRNYRFKWAYNPREAIPEHFHPCKEPTHLCPVCALLGMASEETREERGRHQAKVNAFAGHVAFGAAVCTSEWQQERIECLKTLNTPKPSCRSFYLHPQNPDTESVAEEEYVKLENGRLRTTPARGRKFYWHHASRWHVGGNWKDYFQKLPPIGQQRKPTDLNSTVDAVMPGATFEFTVEFENLSEMELGMLLWTLTLPEEGNLAHHLGGGKPIGLGSVKITVKSLSLIDRARRYENLFDLGEHKRFGDGAAAIDFDLPENAELALYLDAFREEVKSWNELAIPENELRDIPHVHDLLTMLSLDQPQADEGQAVRISYPPGSPGEDKDDTHFSELHYTWFGAERKDGGGGYGWGRRLLRVDEIRTNQKQTYKKEKGK